VAFRPIVPRPAFRGVVDLVQAPNCRAPIREWRGDETPRR